MHRECFIFTNVPTLLRILSQRTSIPFYYRVCPSLQDCVANTEKACEYAYHIYLNFLFENLC